MKVARDNMKRNEWTHEDIVALPNWAREIVTCIIRTREAAYLYRRQAVAMRTALHDLCKDDHEGLAFYDSVCKMAERVFAELEKCDSKELAAKHDKIRAEVIREAKRMQGKVKVLKTKCHAPVEAYEE